MKKTLSVLLIALILVSAVFANGQTEQAAPAAAEAKPLSGTLKIWSPLT